MENYEQKLYPGYSHWKVRSTNLGFTSIDTALKTLYLRGSNIIVLSELFSTTPNAIRQHILRILPQATALEISSYKRYNKLLYYISQYDYTSVDQFLIDANHSGKTPRNLAKILHVSVTMIRKHFHRLGLKLASRGGPNNKIGGRIKHFYQGIPLKQWCREHPEHDMTYPCIMHRINHGWSISNAVITPKQKCGRPRTL